jgi:hypothetical protein
VRMSSDEGRRRVDVVGRGSSSPWGCGGHLGGVMGGAGRGMWVMGSWGSMIAASGRPSMSGKRGMVNSVL